MLLALAAAVAVLMSVMTYFSTTSAALPNLAGIVVSPFRSAAASLSEAFQRWTGYFTEVDALREENRQLKLQIAEMAGHLRPGGERPSAEPGGPAGAAAGPAF